MNKERAGQHHSRSKRTEVNRGSSRGRARTTGIIPTSHAQTHSAGTEDHSVGQRSKSTVPNSSEANNSMSVCTGSAYVCVCVSVSARRQINTTAVLFLARQTTALTNSMARWRSVLSTDKCFIEKDHSVANGTYGRKHTQHVRQQSRWQRDRCGPVRK